jgi:hypothetical protein
MQEYLKNIVKRIQGYSKELDAIEVFVDKKWMLIDESGRRHQYTFMRDKRLLMSLNGITKTGSWELLPTKQLLINRVSDEILLDKFFIQNALLIMKLSGTDDEPFVLINKDEIPDLNVGAYLECYESERKASIDDGQDGYYLNPSGQLSGDSFYKGLVIQLKSGELLNGIYKTTRSFYSQFVELKNNVITRVYFLINYKYNGTDISIEQVEPYTPQVGDKVKLDTLLVVPSSLEFKVVSSEEEVFTLTCTKEGVIKEVNKQFTAFDYFIIAMVAVFLIIIIFIIIRLLK